MININNSKKSTKSSTKHYNSKKCHMFCEMFCFASQNVLNPLSTNITKWSNTLKQFVVKLSTNCLSVFDHFVGLVLKGLRHFFKYCLSFLYPLKILILTIFSNYFLHSSLIHFFIWKSSSTRCKSDIFQ